MIFTNPIDIRKILYLFLFLGAFSSTAQDLEPRFLSSVPIKGNFGGLVYGYSNGNILLDNSLPIEDLDAKLNTVAAAYIRSFSLFNKLAKFDVTVPYSFAKYSALLEGVNTTANRDGFGDASLRLSIILLGEQPLELKDFAQRERKKFKFGTSLKVRIPTGQYDDTKLINYGSNRWGFLLKAAASYNISQKFILEGHLDGWFFTKNDSFLGNELTQKPLGSVQLNGTYIFSRKIWMSLALGYAFGGETTVDGVPQGNDQNNSRYGFTTSYQLTKNSGLKFAITNKLYTLTGADFSTYILGYSFMWFDKKKN